MISQCIISFFICIHICISERHYKSHTHVEFIKFYCKKFICCTQCISESQMIFLLLPAKEEEKK